MTWTAQKATLLGCLKIPCVCACWNNGRNGKLCSEMRKLSERHVWRLVREAFRHCAQHVQYERCSSHRRPGSWMLESLFKDGSRLRHRCTHEVRGLLGATKGVHVHRTREAPGSWVGLWESMCCEQQGPPHTCSVLPASAILDQSLKEEQDQTSCQVPRPPSSAIGLGLQ